MPTLVLASTSPYRRTLLARLGVPFQAHAPRCDEEALKEPALAPDALACMLARAKAESIAEVLPEAYVIGCDQLVELDGEVLGKPSTRAAAIGQLERLAGRSHQLLTAFVLRTPDGRVREHLDRHVLTMRTLGREAIARYVDADLPLDCAGSYKIEERGIVLFERIVGDDFTAIPGLPLIALTRMLTAEGFAIP